MPLVTLALGAYIAGLLSGFAASDVLVALTLVAIGIAVRRYGGIVTIALAALALAGATVATSVRRSDARCVAAAAGQTTLVIVLDDSAGPGAYASAQLVGCAASIRLSVGRGAAPAGATVSASGAVVQSQRGLIVQHASIILLREPSRLSSVRTAAGLAVDRTFGSDAPLVRALVIADRTELTPEVRDSFAAAGLAHILAIAGLHIGVFAAMAALAFELVGVSRQRATTITVILVVAYVTMIGAPVAAVRSATMLLTLFASRLAQRPTSRWAIVVLGAVHPVLDPRVVVAPGYLLSVVGVAAMIAAGRLGKRMRIGRRSDLVKTVVVILVGATVATIASAPIVAWVFGRVSLIAPLSNLVAAPLIGLAQPIVLCALLLSPMHGVATFLADAAHPLLAALTFVAATSAAVPYGSLIVSPTIPTAVVACVMSASVIVACCARAWRRPAGVALAAAVTLVWWPLTPSGNGLVELHMIDVGQGDAIALRTAHGHWVLFDSGRAWHGGDAGRSTILPYLGRRSGSLDLFVLSHPHTDHVGGAATVLTALHPARYIDAGFPGSADAYRASLAAARDSHVLWTRAHPGDSVAIDGVSITFLAPDSAWTASLVDPNLASVVALVRVGRVRMLLMGDAEQPEEEWLLHHWPGGLHADILKVGHHGSSTSTSAEFLRAVHPRVALVSVGAGNSYHLPSPSVMRALAAQGAQVLRTDRLGTIVARTDGETIVIEAAGDSWELPGDSVR